MDECVPIKLRKVAILSAGSRKAPCSSSPTAVGPSGPSCLLLKLVKDLRVLFISFLFANSLVLSCHLQELWLPRRCSSRYQRTGSQNSLVNSEKWRPLKVLLRCSLKSWICKEQKYLKRTQKKLHTHCI